MFNPIEQMKSRISLILYPSGRIVYQYLSMQSTVLNQATIGLQNQARNDGVTVVFNNTYVHDNLAIAFQPVPRWATYAPTSGVVAAGACQDVAVTFDSASLAHGVEDATLRFQANNDPYLATQDVPLTLTVNRRPTALPVGATVECTGNRSAAASLSEAGSSDPDGDP